MGSIDNEMVSTQLDGYQTDIQQRNSTQDHFHKASTPLSSVPNTEQLNGKEHHQRQNSGSRPRRKQSATMFQQ